MRSTPLLFLATLTVLSTASAAQVWTQVTSPTDQDLNGVVVIPGLALTVGNGGVVLASDGGPWTAVDSGTGKDLLDVAYNPATGFAVGGIDVLLEGDGTTPFTPLVETMTGQPYTPVLATDDAVWFGQPSFDFGGFSLLSRYVRSSGTTPGIVVEGPVLLLCAVPGTDLLRYVTTEGDVVEIDNGFVKTVLVDQSSSAPLNLINGGFNRDCTEVVATDQISTSLFDVLHVDLMPAEALAHRGAGPGGPPAWALKAMDIFDESEMRSGYDVSPEGDERIVLWRIQKNEQGEDERVRLLITNCDTFKVKVERIDSAPTLVVFDEHHNIISSPAPGPPSTVPVTDGQALVARTTEQRRYVAVGEEGLIAELIEDVPIFSDGFESGLAAWSQATP